MQLPVLRGPSRSPIPSSPSTRSLALPPVFSHSLPARKTLLSLDDPTPLRKELSKKVTFVRQNQEKLVSGLTERISEQLRAVPYDCGQYRQRLEQVNKIFGCAGLELGERDVLVATGRRTLSDYVFVTNFKQHPLSLCCREEVVFRRVDRQGVEKEGEKVQVQWQVTCSQCSKILIRLREGEKVVGEHPVVRKKRLLDFALHVASGRYKKYRLEEDPVGESMEHVKSRVASLPFTLS